GRGAIWFPRTSFTAVGEELSGPYTPSITAVRKELLADLRRLGSHREGEDETGAVRERSSVDLSAMRFDDLSADEEAQTVAADAEVQSGLPAAVALEQRLRFPIAQADARIRHAHPRKRSFEVDVDPNAAAVGRVLD